MGNTVSSSTFAGTDAPVDSARGLRVDQGIDGESGLDVRDLLLLILRESRIQTMIITQAFSPAVKVSDVEMLRSDPSLLNQ